MPPAAIGAMHVCLWCMSGHLTSCPSSAVLLPDASPRVQVLLKLQSANNLQRALKWVSCAGFIRAAVAAVPSER